MTHTTARPRLVLASTSPYRRELLSRLGLPFEAARPEVDETPGHKESASALSRRLAECKALAVSLKDPCAWVLGSDQVAGLDDILLGKPGNRDNALRQLQHMAGKIVEFHTAVALAHDGRIIATHPDITRVHVRPLDEAEIARYVDAEHPLDCAGSFKSEGLGISLFEAIETRDPTALIGLPLIATARLLRETGSFQLP